MGGHSDLTLSSHRRDDQQYNDKREELRQYIPELEHHLQTLRSRGNTWQQCGLFSVLKELHETLTCTKRVPYHVLLGGEDLLKREVLNQQKATEDTVECIWRSSQFRAAIRRKFDEVIVTDDTNVNSQAIEEQLFVKAKTKDEYLDLSARVIIHFKQLKDQRTLETLEQKDELKDLPKDEQNDHEKDEISDEKYKSKRMSSELPESSSSAKKCKFSI